MLPATFFRGICSAGAALVLIGSALPALVPPAHAGGIELPDSARPGAMRPEDVGKPTRPPEPAGEVLEIPPVIDRPLDVAGGPTVMVDAFRLLDARDLPKHDIRVAEVEALLEEQLSRRPEGFTIGQLQEVADAVTGYYRGKGLILAQAVVPVQTIESGVVDLQIFEGKLGRILAEGNDIYDEVLLRIPFKGLVGEPVTKDAIESALLRLTDYPGLTVFGVFQPGQKVGETDIVLRVQEEKRFDIAFRVDNHGLQDTGRGRFRPTIEWNNPTATADRLSLTVLQTYRPKNNTFWAVDYERFFPYGFKFGGQVTRNRFDVGGELARAQIRGETRQYGIWLDKDWLRSRQMNLMSRIGLDKKDSETITRGRTTARDELAILSAELSGDYVDTRFKGLNFATVGYYRGFNDVLGAMGSSASQEEANVPPGRRGGSGRLAAGQFDKVFATVQRLQTVTPNTYMLVRGEYQWSDDLLAPVEQYSVGGPDNVRAFPPAQILFDRALFMSFEIIRNMPFVTDNVAFGNRTWGEIVQLSAFYDHAIGRLNDPLDIEPSGHESFKGAGVQARLNIPGFLEARLQFAWEVGSDDADNERSPQIWGDITYRF